MLLWYFVSYTATFIVPFVYFYINSFVLFGTYLNFSIQRTLSSIFIKISYTLLDCFLIQDNLVILLFITYLNFSIQRTLSSIFIKISYTLLDCFLIQDNLVILLFMLFFIKLRFTNTLIRLFSFPIYIMTIQYIHHIKLRNSRGHSPSTN